MLLLWSHICCFVPAGREGRLRDKVFGTGDGVASRGHGAEGSLRTSGGGRAGLVL